MASGKHNKEYLPDDEYAFFHDKNNKDVGNERDLHSKIANSLAAQLDKQCKSTDNDKHEIRIVLIGRTGSGKSATGNTILGGDYFKSQTSGSSITRKCSRAEAFRNNKRVLVLDTPGLFDTNMTKEKTSNEIAKCVTISCPGPHAFVVVVSIGRFTEEEKKTVEHLVFHFGEEMIRYMLVIFTRRDDIDKSNTTIDEYVKTVPEYLNSILHVCKNRYLAFNNDAQGNTKEEQVNKLFTMIQSMVDENGGSCYTNEMYRTTEARIQSLISEAREKRRLESIKKQRALEDRIAQKYERPLEDMRRKINQMSYEKDDIENKLINQERDAEEQKRTILNLKRDIEIDRENFREESARLKQANMIQHEREMAKRNMEIEKAKIENERKSEELKRLKANNQKLEEEKKKDSEVKNNLKKKVNQESSDTNIRTEIRDNVEKSESTLSKTIKCVTTVGTGIAAGVAVSGPVGGFIGGILSGVAYLVLK